jgi:cyclopropane fatty-acyl-phospholipid synthase-like methyltransferase
MNISHKIRTWLASQTDAGPEDFEDTVRDARVPIRRHDVGDVKDYYEKMTGTYLSGFGEVFQGSRPESTDELLQYVADASGIGEGMRILDAGCGVCGPAIWFADRFGITIEALTISPTQRREAQSRIDARGLGSRITVREGDFHKLASIYPRATFDGVMFLETLCHAKSYRQVLEEARRVLKPGGFLYVKDFYCKDFRSKPEQARASEKDIKKLNDAYQLMLPDIPSILDLILELGFEFKYVREPQYKATFTYWMQFEEQSPKPWKPELSYMDLISALEIYCRVPA